MQLEVNPFLFNYLISTLPPLRLPLLNLHLRDESIDRILKK
jgi:hypothetical protein